MTDHDRGAYTPHTDAPLAFDARGPRERRPIPMTLVGSAAVLVVITASVFMIYRHGARGPDGSPRPVGEPVGQIKTVAAPGAQPRDPAAGLDVYAAQNVPATPEFAPAPEQPMARPSAGQLQVRAAPEAPPVRIETPPAAAAVTTTTVQAPAHTTTTTTVAAAPAASAPSASTAVTSTVIRPGAADALARATPRPVAPPAHKATEVATARATDATIDAALAQATLKPARAAAAEAKAVKLVAADAPAKAGGGAVVQIGAFSSAALADKGFHDATSSVGGAAGHGKVVTPVQSGGHTLYRTVIAGFADRTSAKAYCAKLTAQGRTCIVKG